MMLLWAVDLPLDSLLQILSTFVPLANYTQLIEGISCIFFPVKLSTMLVLTHLKKASSEPAVPSEISLAFVLSAKRTDQI